MTRIELIKYLDELAVDFVSREDRYKATRAATMLRKDGERIADLLAALQRLMSGTTTLDDALDAAKQANDAIGRAKGEA